MSYTAAVGFACIISLSAGAEPGRVEVFGRIHPESAQGSVVKSIVCPPGMTSSRRTVKSSADAVEFAEVVRASLAAPAAVPATVDADVSRTPRALSPLSPLREPIPDAQQVVRQCSVAEPVTTSLSSSPAATPSIRQIASDDGVESDSSTIVIEDIETDLASQPLPRFHLGLRETRLLRASENVHRVVPENGHVCDVLVFNLREIALIGKQQGTIQLDLWYDSQGLRRDSYLVTVTDLPAFQPGVRQDLQEIETLIGHLFPGSRIECSREGDRLIVRGDAISQRQAIDIVSMVRRSQLIPVIDLIDVRAQRP